MRELLSTLRDLIGACLVILGIGMLNGPAAFISAGVFVLATSWADSRRTPIEDET